MSLGGWQELEESRLIASSRSGDGPEADALARWSRCDRPAVLGRVEFIEDLDQLAQRVGVDFREIL